MTLFYSTTPIEFTGTEIIASEPFVITDVEMGECEPQRAYTITCTVMCNDICFRVRERKQREPVPPYIERLHPRKDWQVKPYWLRTRSNPKRRSTHPKG